MKNPPMSQQEEGLRRMDGKRYYALFMEQGTGKAQPLDAQVATPSGWRCIGELRPGDEVLAADGSAARVLSVHPQGVKRTYKLTFDDGTATRCCAEHLWTFSDRASRRSHRAGLRTSPWRTAELAEFMDKLTDQSGISVIKMPFAQPLQFAGGALPIPAYVLGVLLGDGCLRNTVAFCSADDEIVERVRAALPQGSYISSNGIDHRVSGCPSWRKAIADLGLLGKYSYEKHIPDAYLTAAKGDRVAVLQGLMDTDGTVENGTAVFGTTSEQLARGVAALIRSLGGRARISTRPAGTYRRADGTLGPKRAGWVVRAAFSVDGGIIPFALARKASKFKPHSKYAPRNRTLKSVEAHAMESCVCISIDHPSQLYVTDDCIVTHNTYTLLADAERAWCAGKIDGLLIFAPNGVHTNWVRREIPEHLECNHIARIWRTAMSKRKMRHVEEVLDTSADALRILAVSYDSLSTEATRKFIIRFLKGARIMGVADESQYIKNGIAARTKHVLSFRNWFLARRILTGTPFDKPWDVFSQAEFLQPGLLGTDSFRAFCAEFAVLADWKEPKTESDWQFARQVEKNPRMKNAVIVAKDDITGLPMYRNLDRLNELIAPWSYRVLKKDCLDLPEKIYTQRFFELSPRQQEAYTLMEDELRIQLDDGTVAPVNALAALVKLQQITSGYVMVPAGPGRPLPELQYVGDENPRLEALLDVFEEYAQGKKVIVWARFREEISAICAALRKAGRKVVEYHGGVKAAAREDAIDAIQKGDADVIVMNQQAGGTGITLTAATVTVYYSNYFSLLRRAQSEDRNHRKGTQGDVIYIDLIADGTIDEAITRALQQKADLAATILGDRQLNVPTGLDE